MDSCFLGKKLFFTEKLTNLIMIDKIRVSIGSASVLGLISIKNTVAPTTCYIMTFKVGHCFANCGFCPQARDSNGSTEMLSRVQWPVFPFKEFLTKLQYISPLKKFNRICVQTLNYPENFSDLREIITEIKKVSNFPISTAIPPMSKEKLKELKLLGVQRIGIALDGATPEIFNKVKGKEVDGPYDWNDHIQKLKDALEIFSDGFVSTHIIVGLGETQKEVINLIENMNILKVLPSLFAFTPIKGTKFENLEQPNLIDYRKIQLGRYLVVYKGKKEKDFTFNSKGEIVNFNINKEVLQEIVKNGGAFLTSGCPSCNRPYYDSRPSGSMFNYPRNLNGVEKDDIYNSLLKFVNQ